MRSFLLIVLSVLLLAVSSPEAAARSAEMTPPTELTLTGADGQPLAADRVRAAILAGAASMGYPWVPQNESPGPSLPAANTLTMPASYAAWLATFTGSVGSNAPVVPHELEITRSGAP